MVIYLFIQKYFTFLVINDILMEAVANYACRYLDLSAASHTKD